MSLPFVETSSPHEAAGAPDLALIHGWGVGRAAWDDPLALLVAHFRVHRVSLPGYDGSRAAGSADDADGSGETTARPDTFDTFDTFDATAAALAAALPAGSTLCGWSLGALLALRATQLAPHRFARLILCGATPCFTQRDDWPHAQPPGLLDGFSAAVADDGASATRRRFVALFNQGDHRARAVTRTFTRTLADEPEAQAPDQATLLRGLDWLRRVDLRAQIAEHAHTAPHCLVVHGEHDPLMPLSSARWLAQALPAARLEVFAGAAHAPFVNDAQRFARLLADFCHA